MIKATNIITDANILNLLSDAKEDDILVDTCKDAITIIREYQRIGNTVCFIKENITLGIGGVSRMHTGVASAWLIVSNKFLNYPKSLLSLCRELINESIEFMKLHRIEMVIDAKHIENIKFAEKLGFFLESKMHWYGPNKQQFLRFVRFQE